MSNVSPKCHAKCHTKCTPYVTPNVTSRSQYVTAACGETSAPEQPTFETDLCTEATGWLASPPEINTGLAGGWKICAEAILFLFFIFTSIGSRLVDCPRKKNSSIRPNFHVQNTSPIAPPIACVGHMFGITGPHFTKSFA